MKPPLNVCLELQTMLYIYFTDLDLDFIMDYEFSRFLFGFLFLFTPPWRTTIKVKCQNILVSLKFTWFGRIKAIIVFCNFSSVYVYSFQPLILAFLDLPCPVLQKKTDPDGSTSTPGQNRSPLVFFRRRLIYTKNSWNVLAVWLAAQKSLDESSNYSPSRLRINIWSNHVLFHSLCNLILNLKYVLFTSWSDCSHTLSLLTWTTSGDYSRSR